jgi:lauroyl/myristoyl acyltransferase
MSERATYLSSTLIPLRALTGRWYALYRPGTNTLVATDRVGFMAAIYLLRGYPLARAQRRLAHQHAVSVSGFEALGSVLWMTGALGDTPAVYWRVWLRYPLCLGLGVIGSVCCSVLPHLPDWLLARLLDWIPRNVLAYRALTRASQALENELRSCEALDVSEDQYRQVVRAICVASARNAMLGSLLVLSKRERAIAFLSHLIVVRGAEAMRAAVAERGAVVACLHSDGLPSLFALHAYTYERAACVVSPENINIRCGSAAPTPDMVAQAFGTLVHYDRPLAARVLLQHLHAGGILTLPFDVVPAHPARTCAVSFLGWQTPASEGPAWLALRAGAPLFFATTRFEGRRIIIEYSSAIGAASGGSRSENVVSFTKQLYAQAEGWLRAHPAQWLGWTYFPQNLARSRLGDVPLKITPADEEIAEA